MINLFLKTSDNLLLLNVHSYYYQAPQSLGLGF